MKLPVTTIRQLAQCSAIGTAILLSTSPAPASFHFYRIQEIFTTADGSTQFIELFTTPADQNFLAGHAINATSDGATQTFTFPSNISNGDADTSLLLGTSNLASLAGGVAPDFVIPNNFFNPAANSITINFGLNADSITFANSALPKDGFLSLVDTLVTPFGGINLITATNSPSNSSGANGMIDLRAPTASADFNASGGVDAADFAVWSDSFGLAMGALRAQGDADGDADVDGRDFQIWQQQRSDPTSLASASAVPEPTLAALLLAGLSGLLAHRRGSRNGRRQRDLGL